MTLNLKNFRQTFFYKHIYLAGPASSFLILIGNIFAVITLLILTNTNIFLILLTTIGLLILLKLTVLHSYVWYRYKPYFNPYTHLFWIVYTIEDITDYELAMLKLRVKEMGFDNVLFENSFWDNFETSSLQNLSSMGGVSSYSTILVRSPADLTQILLLRKM